MDKYVACTCGCGGIMKVTGRAESDPALRLGTIIMMPYGDRWQVCRVDLIHDENCRPATPKEIETFKIEYAKWRLNGGTNG